MVDRVNVGLTKSGIPRKRALAGTFDRTSYQREFMRKKRREDYIQRLREMSDDDLRGVMDQAMDRLTMASAERQRRESGDA